METSGEDEIRTMGLSSLGFLRRQEEREEEEEKQREAEDFSTRTNMRCSYCDEHIHFVEEVVHFRIARPLHTGSEVVFLDFVVEEEGPDFEDYVYPPHWLEFTCWEDLVSELNEMVEDSPPTRHEESVRNCDHCGSGICEQELCAVGYLGEIHVSDKMPNGVVTEEFAVSSQDPFVMCLSCLNLVNDHTIELWEPEDLNQAGECQECTHARCWRWSGCGCICHEEKVEE